MISKVPPALCFNYLCSILYVFFRVNPMTKIFRYVLTSLTT
ncbi:hypothetical protein Cassandra_0050 [Pseudomonas phage Cassandra]|nr:hypothetical protein Cassandra_0050 [Pseudomonas phage Cassandra]